MRNFKICFVLDEFDFETSWGGIATSSGVITKALSALGNEVFIITSGKKNEYNQNGRVHLFRIKTSGIEPSSPLLTKITSRLVFYAKICALIKKIDAKYSLDVVRIPEARSLGLIYSLFKDSRLITEICMPTAFVHRLNNKNDIKNKMISYIYELAEKIQTRNSAGIIYNTLFLKNIISKRWRVEEKKNAVISSGINIKDAEELSRRRNILNEKNYILYFGRLEINKGVGLLIDAMPKILGLFPEQKAAFVGEDRGLKRDILKLKEKYAENIIISDRVSHEDIFPIIRDAKLVVLPSILENMSMACIEAMALGKVVIATRNTGFEEVIEDKKTGFLVEPGNIAELADKIIYCLELHSLDDIGENAKKAARERFNADEIVKETMVFYEKVVA